ncbi:hypothetical protein [Thauera humireducens]|uniref:hypothetical protein n=1 Tax=Thauera humireducens TaxID=1134435 RepID=UPI00311E7C93
MKAAREHLGGEAVSAAFWVALREQTLDFFSNPAPLWRISVANDSRPRLPEGAQLVDWGRTALAQDRRRCRHLARRRGAAGGHACCFTPGAAESPLHPLPEVLMRYHRRLKEQLDPQGIFNPGRMYDGL